MPLRVDCRSWRCPFRTQTRLPLPPLIPLPPASCVRHVRRLRSSLRSRFQLAFFGSSVSRPDSALFYFSWPLRSNSTTESLPGTPYSHRTGESGGFSGQTQTFLPLQTLAGKMPAHLPHRRRYIRSAARIFALRERGLRSISSSDAI